MESCWVRSWLGLLCVYTVTVGTVMFTIMFKLFISCSCCYKKIVENGISGLTCMPKGTIPLPSPSSVNE